MSSLASVTNQRLDVARRFLSMPSNEQKWMGAAFENAALFYIQSAFLGLLQEVKQAYHLSSEIELSQMQQAAKSKQISIPVINELIELKAQANSWLSRLEQEYKICLECQPRINHVKQDSLIASVSESAPSCLMYLNALTEVVLRFREESSEY